MEKNEQKSIEEAKERLIEVAGRTSQDFGLGRIMGQVMAAVYFTQGAASLDEIGERLKLSKAAVSIATRQLERLGVIQRVWKKGNRKNFFRVVDNLASALQNGVLDLFRSKLRMAGEELDIANECLKTYKKNDNKEINFLVHQIERAKSIQNRASWLLNNPIVKHIGR